MKFKKSFSKFITNIMWACSSVVERYVDIVEAISSILIMPTIYFAKRNHNCKINPK